MRVVVPVRLMFQNEAGDERLRVPAVVREIERVSVLPEMNEMILPAEEASGLTKHSNSDVKPPPSVKVPALFVPDTQLILSGL